MRVELVDTDNGDGTTTKETSYWANGHVLVDDFIKSVLEHNPNLDIKPEDVKHDYAHGSQSVKPITRWDIAR